MSQLNSIPFGQSSSVPSAPAGREYVANAPSALSVMTGAEIAAWGQKHAKDEFIILRVPVKDALAIKPVVNTWVDAKGATREGTDLFGIDLTLQELSGQRVMLKAFSGFGKRGPWAKLVVCKDNFVPATTTRPVSSLLD